MQQLKNRTEISCIDSCFNHDASGIVRYTQREIQSKLGVTDGPTEINTCLSSFVDLSGILGTPKFFCFLFPQVYILPVRLQRPISDSQFKTQY